MFKIGISINDSIRTTNSSLFMKILPKNFLYTKNNLYKEQLKGKKILSPCKVI